MKILDAELPRSYWRSVAARNGISSALFRQRLYHWGDMRRAATQPKRKGSSRRRPGSLAEKMRQAGLHRDSLLIWRRRHPDSDLSDDEVIAVIRENKRRRENSRARLAREARRNPKTVQARVSKGVPLERALSEPPMSRRERGVRGKAAGWGRQAWSIS